MKPARLRRTAILALGIMGCSVEDRYVVLSTFFDGVPPPGGSAATRTVSSQYMQDTDDGAAAAARPKVYYHAPFVKERCSGCHPEKWSLYIPEDRIEGLCYNCHEHKPFQEKVDRFTYVHGPVAARICLVCHDPHESLYPGVLVEADPKVCHRCHEKSLDPANKWHKGFDVEPCLPCHDPHGGEDRLFLRGAAKA